MRFRQPHELAGLVRNARKRAGWSQTKLAQQVGVSRQWISLVENGKTSVEFDLVLRVLQALGYQLSMDFSGAAGPQVGDVGASVPLRTQGSTARTPLTFQGEPLGRQRARRKAARRAKESSE